ncbi:MAG: hypothetical protein LBU82_04920 [Treponema sp.]|jgi:hypothetical protein|nr:hypothetical protein [Treponema sp.]
MSDELNQLLRESFEYMMSNVHTSFPGVIVKYDAKKRRADIQPSMKRKMPDGKFMEFPVIPDVPVQFPGTKRFTIHIPLEKGDEVSVIVIERSTDIWRDQGGSGIEDADPRRFNLQDCYAVPGLQSLEFILADEPGLQILHKDKFNGKFISQILMTDDKIETKYKEKAKITLEDDHITAKTEKCTADMTKDVITVKNSKSTLKLRSDKFSEKNQSETMHKIIKDFMQIVNDMITNGPPPMHKVNPATKLKLKKLMMRWSKLTEA